MVSADDDTVHGLFVDELLHANSFELIFSIDLGTSWSLDVLDISRNYLTGVIPSVLGGFPSHFMVHLNGNSNL